MLGEYRKKAKRIVPICIEFPFITSKLQDFNTYATVVEKIAQGQHLTTEGINQIVEFVSQKRKASNNNKDKIGYINNKVFLPPLFFFFPAGPLTDKEDSTS